MTVTNIENQSISFEKKIELFYQATKPYSKDSFCPVKDVLSQALDKWSIFCLLNLAYYKCLRFNELKGKIRGISSRMLSVTLKRLEEQKIVKRKVYAEVPPKVEYSLTPFGMELSERLLDLSAWFLMNFPGAKKKK